MLRSIPRSVESELAEIERREQFKADAATQANSTGGVFGLVSGASAADLDVIEERPRWANFTERNPVDTHTHTQLAKTD